MSDPFIWTPKLTKQLFELRFKNEWLFKNKRQPWHEFREILTENGFPEEITLNHIRKKWTYTYDRYKIAKKMKNKKWKYYKMFDKHFGKTEVLDKYYETWNDEWRTRLITCVTEAKALNLDMYTMWKHVEKSLRCLDLPGDCCIQDIKSLWQHLKSTFNRKHRFRFRKGASIDTTEWPLYDAMLSHYSRFEPELLRRLEIEGIAGTARGRRPRGAGARPAGECKEGDEEFQWSKDITETFIQIRLQHDWLFREKKWAWNDMQAIMVKEYGFPKTLSGRELGKKWTSTFSDYQKAIATNNTSWLYYNLFECYLGEGSFSINPLSGWKEEWVSRLIAARAALEAAFHQPRSCHAERHGWREVEKRLRSEGLPIDHSLFDIPEIWTHLLKTYRWKRKFADRGMLTEQWPYYEAMTSYTDLLKTFKPPETKPKIKKPRYIGANAIDDHFDDAAVVDDDFDDDLKLFDLKKKLELKPKTEVPDVSSCRACNVEEGSYHVFEACDDEGVSLAHKLRVIAGVEIDVLDNLPKQICFNCLKELENSYSFRRKCQDADKELRNIDSNNIARKDIKIELKLDEEGALRLAADDGDKSDFHDFDAGEGANENDAYNELEPLLKKEKKRRIFKKKRKQPKTPYEYSKMCEICGKKTRNLKSHLDMHATGKAYRCDVCDKRFQFKSGLTIHKAVHNPTPKKTCEVCGKTFHILAQYRRHFVYHANERRHACETCGKRFNTIEILKVHLRMHTDERPFACDECGKTFRTAGCVSRHRRIVHKKKCKSNNNSTSDKDT
ncbi:unnamed protein product [Plutella xylostella]|uniref:(diamondback moth) hypothetical protein n=1 Tax=Plutella xylostella TaxID=51655 RepID=A0A8S4E9L5_PLUXY|nr:unnamed protein product [Plutella xylostella]